MIAPDLAPDHHPRWVEPFDHLDFQVRRCKRMGRVAADCVRHVPLQCGAAELGVVFAAGICRVFCDRTMFYSISLAPGTPWACASKPNKLLFKDTTGRRLLWSGRALPRSDSSCDASRPVSKPVELFTPAIASLYSEP